jgi:hypothetical protein
VSAKVPDFTNINLNTAEESACTPEVDEDFRGMVIATPDKIDLAAPWHGSVGRPRRPVWPVCGTVQYSAATGARFRSFSNQILLVAVEARTHAPYVWNLLRKGFDPVYSKRPTPEQLEEWKDRVHTESFNANAFYYIEDLPAAPGRYHVFATIGDIVSNVRTVEIVGKGSERGARHVAPGEAQFGKAARPPAVAADFRGIKIAARVQRWPQSGPVWVDGVVQLADKDAAALGVTPIQRAVVMTASSGMLFWSWSVAGERSLFPDDQERLPGAVRGTFSMEVSQACGASKDEGVYLLVSVGPFVSNVVFLPSN